MQAQAQPESPSLPTHRPAPFGRRFVAMLIDTLVLMSILLWLGMILEFVGFNQPPFNDVVSTAAFALYCIGTWSITGTSVGKWLLGLQLKSESGGCPTRGQAFGRWLVMMILSGLGIAWWPVLFRSDRRGIHDLLAGTYPVLVREQGFLAHLRLAFERYPIPSAGIGCALVCSLGLMLTVIVGVWVLGVDLN